MLYPSTEGVAQLDGRWWIACTRARFEKAFASDVTERVKPALREAGIRTPDATRRDID